MTQAMKQETVGERLERLTDAWKMAKRMEADWNEQRIAVESEIYELIADQLPEKGTFTTDTGMKVVTGFTEAWDETFLQKAYEQWPVEEAKFPFNVVYKPDSKAIAVIREGIPGLYKLIEPALTLKPHKPSFSIPETK